MVTCTSHAPRPPRLRASVQRYGARSWRIADCRSKAFSCPDHAHFDPHRHLQKRQFYGRKGPHGAIDGAPLPRACKTGIVGSETPDPTNTGIPMAFAHTRYDPAPALLIGNCNSQPVWIALAATGPRHRPYHDGPDCAGSVPPIRSSGIAQKVNEKVNVPAIQGVFAQFRVFSRDQLIFFVRSVAR